MSTIQIKVPNWLDCIFASPLMLYRKHKYGYSYRRIYLGTGEWTILDVEDYYKLANIGWALGGYKKNFYAVGGIKNKNGDGLDNRRDNLRIATRGQNVCNKIKTRRKTSSKFIGVSFDKRSGLWVAYVGHLRKKIFLGYFKNKFDAARVYDRAAIKYHGEFARLNFAREDYANETSASISK